MKIVILVTMFLVIGALFIVANENLHLNKSQERERFFGFYYGWLDQLFSKSTTIVGYVAKSEWLPSSNISEPDNEGDIETVFIGNR